MLYGRLILINTTYYNKILDDNDYSYFVAVNKTTNPFIKVKTNVLDKKSYQYSSKIIEASSNLLCKLIDLEQILSYTPFVKKGNESNKINYYKRKKFEKKQIKIEPKFGVINFD